MGTPPEILQHGGKSEYNGQSYGFITFLSWNIAVIYRTWSRAHNGDVQEITCYLDLFG